jgi:hypothetical protein
MIEGGRAFGLVGFLGVVYNDTCRFSGVFSDFRSVMISVVLKG